MTTASSISAITRIRTLHFVIPPVLNHRLLSTVYAEFPQESIPQADALLRRGDPELRPLRRAIFKIIRDVHAYIAAKPPSTGITVPVMKSEASDASSAITPFRSRSLPRRRSGVCSRMYFSL